MRKIFTNNNRLEKRNTVLNADVALAIADYFEVSVRYLLTGEYEKNELTLDERNILVSWRNLDKQGQFEVKALLDAKSTPAPAQKTIQAG
ncbi:MAG: hypothetical protein Ta2B_13910 [Termitinemataceae bacterium]|nr:MAG: hypothetical protein Ta2B_13910 [Termitinemataceae bacterium]